MLLCGCPDERPAGYRDGIIIGSSLSAGNGGTRCANLALPERRRQLLECIVNNWMDDFSA
jgi:hypothetical protein